MKKDSLSRTLHPLTSAKCPVILTHPSPALLTGEKAASGLQINRTDA